MTDFRMDWDRMSRTGTAEAVLCDGKSTPQIDAILAHAHSLDRRLLLTRLAPERYDALALRDKIDYDDVSEVRGLDITITTTATDDDEARELLRELGMPFAS